MSRRKDRIDTSGGRELSADNPFAGLGGLNLPQGKPVPLPQTGQPDKVLPKRREPLLLRRLKAGKGGKVVTEISGFTGAPEVHQRLLKELQGALGTGGTCKGRVLELQGEWREKLKPLLEARGYPVKGI